MGLFDKKFCCLSGQKAGLLGRQKILNGQYICGDCREKCSQNVSWRISEQITPDDVRACMEYTRENEETYSTSFRETYSVNTGIFGGTRVISVDEDNGLWVDASSARPDILTFDQIVSYRLQVDTRMLTEEERREPGRTRMPMPPYGMPGCGPHETITGMEVVVRLNHPWVDEIELKVLNAIFITKGDIVAAYDCAQNLFMYFEQQRANAYRMAQAAGSLRSDGRSASWQCLLSQSKTVVRMLVNKALVCSFTF